MYFGLLLYYVVIGQFWMFISFFAAVILHEMAHAIVGRYCGYEMKKIVLMPYGAMIYGGEQFRDKEGLKIALAGPIASGLSALLTLAVWWLVPDLYEGLLNFLTANVMLVIVNLLPCFPLDGARVVLAICKNKIKALRVLKVLGVIVGIVMFSLGIASLWYIPNITLISVGVFVLIGAISGSKKEEYYFVASKMSYAKDYLRGVTARRVHISCEMRVYSMLRYISESYLTTFVVVDDSGEIVADIVEEQVQDLILRSSSNTKILDIL